MEFQVVTDKQLPRIRVGRSVIAFYYRKNIIGISQGIQDRKTGHRSNEDFVAGVDRP